MEELTGFTLEGDRAVYCPAGSVSFDNAVEMVREAIAAARSHQVVDILVDMTALTGFPAPETFERFFAAVAWAEEANRRLRLALVARREMIDPRKFGVTVARNRDLVCDVFTTEQEARAWLDERRKPNRPA